MKPLRLLLVSVIALFATSRALATDLVTYPLAEALATQVARDKLDPRIQLNFARQASEVVRGNRRDEWRVVARNRRPVNGVSHTEFPESQMTEKEVCQLTFVQALKDLQNKARVAGVQSVEQITSGWAQNDMASDSLFTCAVGVATIGIQLRARAQQR
ncbi:hypothetical protein [Imbroritus primus]|uniref:hypothetical protein n=1 Tax=Imbroritus primus TaxID=3058603 RepID=UPI003D160EF8